MKQESYLNMGLSSSSSSLVSLKKKQKKQKQNKKRDEQDRVSLVFSNSYTRIIYVCAKYRKLLP